MNYKELNKKQKDKIHRITRESYHMKWENPEFIDYLMGKLPKIKIYQNNKKIENELYDLNSFLKTYNAFFTDKDEFIKEIERRITDIKKKEESWYGLSLYEIESYIKLHRFCLISGEGGIGKSYFIKCFEDEIEKNGIEHLCVYGKFEKDAKNIEVNQIIKASNNGFIFIFDAINEMSEEGQKELLEKILELKKYPRIRIIITYRTNSMDNAILERLQEIAEYEYKFSGVSFESALYEIFKKSVPDVYVYEDILYSNNALMLSMLSDVLSDEKITEERENGVASVTFILEQYIKKTISKTFKNIAPYTAVDVWKDTKNVAKWMYENDKKTIDEKSLLAVIKTGNLFISSMRQMGFVDENILDDGNHYYFVVDSLTDFLIARSLFEDIDGLEYEKQINIINAKVRLLYNLEEAFIVLLFDKFSPDYECIKKLLIDTALIERIDSSLLIKIHFKKTDIESFQNVFQLIENGELLTKIGGYTDKPFNCCNYLFKYFSNNRDSIIELSNELSGYYFKDLLKNRLKNLLYFITLNDRTDRRDEEAYYFSILCSAAPNEDIRLLATKLLFEIVSKEERYLEKLISDYTKIMDFYVQETILFVLCNIKRNSEKIKAFFNRIIVKQKCLSSKSIRRISDYLGEPHSYINWNRENDYVHIDNPHISDFLDKILLNVDLYNKDYFPFRYWSRDNIRIHKRFLTNDKRDIQRINEYLRNNYSCAHGGACSGSWAFEKAIQSEVESIANIETMEDVSFFENFENKLKYVFKYYGINEDKGFLSMREEDFRNSVYMKCVDISTGLYYGSLMCNYYTNIFATYNNFQDSIGYEVYDPLEYGEDICITAPIPTYQDFIEKLGDYAINKLEMGKSHNIHWLKDVELTRRNIFVLLEPILINKKEWVLLAGRVYLYNDSQYEREWSDSYDIWCCSSDTETIYDDGKARYLTIELEDYNGELKAYPYNNQKPWLCKRVKNINLQSDIFEETNIVLPPSDIIKFFNLKLNVSDLSWENSEREKVIVCNNNKNSYYEDSIGGTVFIQKDYYDKYLLDHTIKYFSYAERYINHTGCAKETSLHLEIVNGQIVKEIQNDGKFADWDEVSNPMCSTCSKFDFL